jgi:hypothetical protein|tara:strand:+ start:702 stop:884 length:183 start_codon:yes stop_codon:yes gene_type:complete
MIKKFLLAIVAAMALSVALVSIFNFLGTPLSTYGNWIFWLDALVIFYIVLPDKPSSIFSG